MSYALAIFCDNCGAHVLVSKQVGYDRKLDAGQRFFVVNVRKVKVVAYDMGWDEDFTDWARGKDLCPKCCQREAGLLDENGGPD